MPDVHGRCHTILGRPRDVPVSIKSMWAAQVLHTPVHAPFPDSNQLVSGNYSSSPSVKFIMTPCLGSRNPSRLACCRPGVSREG